MKTLLAHRIVWFTPWATWKHPRDHFWPLLTILLAVLAMDVCFLLKVEGDYRRDARVRKAPPLRQDAPGIVEKAEADHYGAQITGMRDGQPQLNW